MSKFTGKINSKFFVILRHNICEYSFCAEESHVHYGTLGITSSEIENYDKLKDIEKNLESIDYIIDMEEYTIETVLEKFVAFCQDYLSVDKVRLEIEHDYVILFELEGKNN